MELIGKLETTMADWYKNVPHLPKNGQKWLVRNVWWIVLIGVILSGFGVAAILVGGLLAGSLLTLFGGIVGAAVGGILLSAILVNIAFSILEVVLLALAILPLKDGRRKGWFYLFIVFLLSILSVIVSFLFHPNVNGFMGLVLNAISLAIWGYFLFEIRDAFTGVKAASVDEA